MLHASLYVVDLKCAHDFDEAQVRIYLFFGVPKMYFNPAFEAGRPVRVFCERTQSLHDSEESLALKAARTD